MPFGQTHAKAFSDKLTWKRKDPSLPRIEVRVNHDGAHRIQAFYLDGKFLFHFGIKHSPRRDAPHGWVARNLGLSPRYATDFANCNVTVDDMIETLMEKGWIPRPEAATEIAEESPPAIVEDISDPTPEATEEGEPLS